MNADGYYKFQSIARGLNDERDVQVLVDAYAPIYDRVMVQWLPSNKAAARIYEAACGNGIFLRWAQSRGWGNLEGSDFSEREAAMARSAGFEVKAVNSIDDLKAREDSCFEAIVAIDFIEHLAKSDFLEFLSQCQRTLRPNGSLILRAPNGDSPFVGLNLFNDVTHVWCYTTTALRSLARMAGFSSIEFIDDTVVSIQRMRWLKLPAMILSQRILKSLIRSAVHEQLHCLGASYYARIQK